MKKIYPVFFLALLLANCQMIETPGVIDLDAQLETVLLEASGGEGMEVFLLPESHDFGQIPQDPLNPLTAEKVALGQRLFHEPKMGIFPKKTEGLYTYSCASCHVADAGFQACIQQGLGEGGLGFGVNGEKRKPSADYDPANIDRQPIRTPSNLNIAFQEVVLWNGQFGGSGMNLGTEAAWASGTPIEKNHLGYEGTETQAIAGLDVHRMGVDSIIKIQEYKDFFDQAFSDVPEIDRYSKETAGLAMAAYERTLLSNEAPFQRWLKGEAGAMDAISKRGAMLFFGKAGCVSCHKGPALNDMSFHALGMADLNGDGIYIENQDNNTANLGRGGFTGRSEDMYKFKVPQLYNLVNSPFFGHGGTFNSVREVVEYKNRAFPENSNVPLNQLSPEFVPLELSEIEITHLTYFIEHALKDPSLDRYNPNYLPSGVCFPNNDIISKRDMGCN
ncbi:MAG: cytochrome-c peroxidase [Bacteroidetes bacterium]|nr:cytochrome-c peroxidase [Bacteroidota bacterium]